MMTKGVLQKLSCMPKQRDVQEKGRFRTSEEGPNIATLDGARGANLSTSDGECKLLSHRHFFIGLWLSKLSNVYSSISRKRETVSEMLISFISLFYTSSVFSLLRESQTSQ